MCACLDQGPHFAHRTVVPFGSRLLQTRSIGKFAGCYVVLFPCRCWSPVRVFVGSPSPAGGAVFVCSLNSEAEVLIECGLCIYYRSFKYGVYPRKVCLARTSWAGGLVSFLIFALMIVFRPAGLQEQQPSFCACLVYILSIVDWWWWYTYGVGF